MRKTQADLDRRRIDFSDLMTENPELAKGFWERLDLSWVIHENALEGIVVTQDELAASLEPMPKDVNEVGKIAFIASIRRQREAIALTKQEAKKARSRLTLPLLKRVFESLSGGGDGKGKFEYRQDMPLHRSYFHEISQPPEIVPEITKLMEWTGSQDFAILHPLQQAAAFHHRFMKIFPFTELSGKVGRLLMNIIVMRAGYLPAVISGTDRQRYYESLKQSPAQLQVLISDTIENTTDIGFRLFGVDNSQASRIGGAQ